MVTLEGSFKIDSTNDPDIYYDGGTDVIEFVNRDSAGLFTVTLADWIPYIPTTLVTKLVSMDRAAVPTQPGSVEFVLGSWDPAARTFQVAFTGPTDADGADSDAAPAAKDPDDNDVINFFLRGSAQYGR